MMKTKCKQKTIMFIAILCVTLALAVMDLGVQYRAWAADSPYAASDFISATDGVTVSQTETGIKAEQTDASSTASYTVNFNALFTGNMKLDFSTPMSDKGDQYHTFKITAADNSDFFEVIFRTTGYGWNGWDGWYTMAYVKYHDLLFAQENYRAYDEWLYTGYPDGRQRYTYGTAAVDSKMMLAGLNVVSGQEYTQKGGFLALTWENDVLCVRVKQAASDENKKNVIKSDVLAKFDGSSRPLINGTLYVTDDENAPDGHKFAAADAAYGLPKLPHFKNGYTVSFTANDTAKSIHAKPYHLPITFTSIATGDGVTVGADAHDQLDLTDLSGVTKSLASTSWNGVAAEIKRLSDAKTAKEAELATNKQSISPQNIIVFNSESDNLQLVKDGNGVTAGLKKSDSAPTDSYTAKINGTLRGDSKIEFSLLHKDEAGDLNSQAHTFRIRSISNPDEYFDVVFYTAQSYSNAFTGVYVDYKGWKVSRQNFKDGGVQNAVPESDRSSVSGAYERVSILYGKGQYGDWLWNTGFGTNPTSMIDAAGVNWENKSYVGIDFDRDGVMTIRTKTTPHHGAVFSDIVARFDGTDNVRPTATDWGGEQRLLPESNRNSNGEKYDDYKNDKAVFGLPDIGAAFQDGYTVEFMSNTECGGAAPTNKYMPITFTAINGIDLTGSSDVLMYKTGNSSVEFVAAANSYAEAGGTHYVMQNATKPVANVSDEVAYKGITLNDLRNNIDYTLDTTATGAKSVTVNGKTVSFVVETPYTVTYALGFTPEAIDALQVAPASQKYSEHIKAHLALPTFAAGSRKGYNFAGWKKQGDESVFTQESFASVSGDITLVAQWTLIAEHGISYHNVENIDTSSFPTSYVQERGVTLPEPQKSGYAFGGWYTDAGFNSEKITEISATATSDYVLYAQWNKIYTVGYSLNGGTLASGDAQFAYTERTSEPVTLGTPTKENHKFGGWYFTSDFSGTKVTVINDSTLAGKNADVTLYAKFLPVRTVTYHLDGGTNGSNPATFTADENDITLASATKSGYRFMGWYTDSEMTANKIETIDCSSDADVTVYAKFAKIYTVHFSAVGATIDGENSVEIILGDEVTMPTATKDHAIFQGWYKENSFVNRVEKTSDLTESDFTNDEITLYAQFSGEAFWLRHVLNGGMGVQDTQYEANAGTIVLVAPTRTGYTFEGWFESSDFSGNAIAEINGGLSADKTVYAKWSEPISYSVTYELNGGTAGANPVTAFTVESGDLALVAPTRDGYTFEGWFDNAEFAGEKVEKIVSGSYGDKKFYAKWKEIIQDNPGGDDDSADDNQDLKPGGSNKGCGSNMSGIDALSIALVLLGAAFCAIKRKV